MVGRWGSVLAEIGMGLVNKVSFSFSLNQFWFGIGGFDGFENRDDN